MRRAIELALESVRAGGGPFGAVVVRDGRVVGRGTNQVTQLGDPTAHAEIAAIRDACRALGTFELSGCTLYTSCEPCPMCLGAVYWSRLERVCYGSQREDAARVGFDDALIYEELARAPERRRVTMTQLLRDEALRAFVEWDASPDRVPY